MILMTWLERESEGMKSHSEQGHVRRIAPVSTTTAKFEMYELNAVFCYILWNVHLIQLVRNKAGDG